MQSNLMPRIYKGTFWVEKLPCEDDWSTLKPEAGLSVSEDDKHVYAEAAVSGVDPDKLDVTLEKGVLWVRGGNFCSYSTVLPYEVNEFAEPLAVYKNGVIKITFTKKPESQPRKIFIKKE